MNVGVTTLGDVLPFRVGPGCFPVQIARVLTELAMVRTTGVSQRGSPNFVAFNEATARSSLSFAVRP